jgi:hypothetical protein
VRVREDANRNNTKSPSSHPLLQKKKAGSYLNYELFLSTGKREAHQESEPVEEKKRGE